VRDRYFDVQGFSTLRFWNDEVTDDIDAVRLRIRKAAGR
jgi:very-short-patch-repair endonuclease